METGKYIDINAAVASALEGGRPVVGFATSFISGGMSYPQNSQTAKTAKSLIEGAGCECAFLAVIKGKIKVGLESGEIETLGRLENKAEKITARDLPIAVAQETTGVMTVSAAAAVCKKLGIKILVTDAIDGFYGEEKFPDADAIGDSSLMVISSGVKTFMDPEKTAKVLSSVGTATVGVNSTKMAAFYCRESECSTDTYVSGPDELVTILKVMDDMEINGSILVSNPVPSDSALAPQVAKHACDTAVSKALENGVRGKESVSFIMALVTAMTGGMAADAQIACVISNANLAATVAVRCGGFMPKEETHGISDEEFDTIKASIDADLDAKIAQRMQGMGMYMNPYMNPYFPQPAMGQNPYQQMPMMGQMPQMPVAPQQPMPSAAAPMEYVNPYKPQRAEPVAEPQVKTEPEVPSQPQYKAVSDEEWVNPFAPKHDKPQSEDADVIARPAEEVMAMIEDTVKEENGEVEEVNKAEAAVEEALSEKAETETEAAVEKTVEAETETEAEAEAKEPEEEMPSGGGNGLNLNIPPMPPKEETEKELQTEEKEDDNTLTEYVPPVHEKKQRKPDNQDKPQQDEAGMTSYDPEFYKKRAAERKQRIAEAAGEAKHVEEAKAAEPDYIECKGPLEFTGEHPWAWKCTKCGQLFQKHEIPHKCVKTD